MMAGNESFLIYEDIGALRNETIDAKAIEQDNCTNITQKLWDRHWELADTVSWWFEGVGLCVVAFYGILLNCLAIAILSSKKLSSFFNLLLVWLSIFDAFFLLFSTLYHFAVFEPSLLQYYWTTTIFIYVISPLRSMVMLCSIYITVALSYDRYTAVSNPSEYKIKERMGSSDSCSRFFRTMKYVGGIILFSVVFYLPKFLDLETSEVKEECTINTTAIPSNGTNDDEDCLVLKYSIKGTALRNNDKFVLWYVNVANFLVTVAIPLLSLIYLNIKIYRKVQVFIRRQPSSKTGARLSNAAKERSKDIQQAYQLFAIVFLFLSCHFLRVSLNIEEFINMNKKILTDEKAACELPRNWSRGILPPVSHFLLQFNSSTNFFVYCFFNKTFRLILKDKFMNLLSICCPKLLAYLTVNDNNNKQDNANGNNSAQPNTNRPTQDTGYLTSVETKPCEQGNVKRHESSAIVQNNTCSQGNQINTVVEMTPRGAKKVAIIEEKQIIPNKTQ